VYGGNGIMDFFYRQALRNPRLACGEHHIIPEFAVAIYCGLKILAATLVYCF
jgi:hypothetical protein